MPKNKSSSGSSPKSKRTASEKVGEAMHEMKHGELQSGRSGKKVKNPKQAIAIGLSEARRAGADIPEPPSKKGAKKTVKNATKKAATKKTTAKKATKKTAVKKAAPKKAAAKKTAAKKTTTKKTATKTAAKKKATKKS